MAEDTTETNDKSEVPRTKKQEKCPQLIQNTE